MLVCFTELQICGIKVYPTMLSDSHVQEATQTLVILIWVANEGRNVKIATDICIT